ncbi:hypothetical protein [Polyangium spumosum]|uniref:Uncharacterized protein n=1 Tax=Polyangium spumosum TaxID=889282 RepID=A0A6N7PN17_9BACT|nr:hypothetical protein [Polyangium spumosum]MRG93552.1 hypothetical protein [Polyangium spumosum]
MRRGDFFVATLVVAAFVAFLCVLTGCAPSRDPMMARVFEAPNVIHVCVRPPNVPKNQASWAVTASGDPLTAPSEVDLARRNGLAVYVFDPNAPPRSAKLLPIPHHRLECPAPPKPRVVVAKVEGEGEKKKEETKKAEPSKPKPRPIAKRIERCPEAGQARRRGGTGSRTCTRVLIKRPSPEPVVAENQPPPGPRPVEPPLPKHPSEINPGEVWVYEKTWRLPPEDVALLDRAYECAQGVCHARHKNFAPNAGKPAGKHNGQSLSTASGSVGGAKIPRPVRTTTVKTRTKTVGKPNGGAAGQGSPANAGAAANGRRVPNPDGKKGGKAHRDKVDEVAKDIKKRGLDPVKEYPVDTPGGPKKKRYMDVAGVDRNTKEPVEFHQVGKQRKDGQPVSRERKPIDEVERAKGIRPKFHPYNDTKK